MSEVSSKRGCGDSYRHLSWKACWCRHCPPNSGSGKAALRRSLHKSARQEARRVIREEIAA